MPIYDPEADRKIAKNWREYFSTIGESIGVYRWVWDELIDAPARKWVKRLVVALVIIMTFQFSMDWFIRYVFDGLVGHDLRLIVTGIAAYVMAEIARRGVSVLRVVCRERVFGFNMSRRQHRVTELFFSKSLGQHAEHHDLLSSSNMEKGLGKVSESQSILMYNGVEVVLGFVLSMVFLWIISPVAGAVMTVSVVIHMIWSLYLNRIIIEVCTPLDAKFRAFNRYMRERWKQIRRVKASAKEDEELAKMSQWFTDILGIDFPFWVRYGTHGVARGFITTIFVVIVLIYGAWMVYNGHWEIGILYPIFTWSGLIRDYLWRLSEVEHQLNWNFPSIASLQAALEIESDIKDVDSPVVLSDDEPIHIDFDSVSYSYGDVEVLRDVSFTIEPGRKVALLGKSGSGKSTLTKLLLREMDPSSGVIRVNGHDLRDIQLSSWLNRLGHVPQEPAVFDGTLRYNLTYGLPAKVAEQTDDARIHALMENLQIDFARDGLKTEVGEGGIKLSGGQQQRVMIAAAVMKSPTVFIADEATCHLDSHTEEELYVGLDKELTTLMSAVFIAHDFSTVRKRCDKFVVLRPVKGLGAGESQVEAIADKFEDLWPISATFRSIAVKQGIDLSS
ncbi:ABC transporter ATP-binding protein [Candidatus Uhrbacteria bacterium]|nr:ABC transporter ATP-binding protein [Candidatus Uhrbacteria bacterium]